MQRSDIDQIFEFCINNRLLGAFFSTQASTPQITFWNGRIRWVGSLALREMGGGFVHHYITFDLDLDYVSPYLTYLSLTTDSFVYY